MPDEHDDMMGGSMSDQSIDGEEENEDEADEMDGFHEVGGDADDGASEL